MEKWRVAARMAGVLGVVLLGLACGDKDDGDSAGAAASPAESCDTMCTGLGFDGGAAQEYDHEVNCTCSGTGTVDESSCAAMCTDIGWSGGEVYSSDGSTMNSCQCS